MCSSGGDEMLPGSERDLVSLFEKRQRDRVAACAAHNPTALQQHPCAGDASFPCE